MVPYPNVASVDPSEELRKQNYTVEKLFTTADDFYASMGLRRVPQSLFEKSLMRKPTDGRQVLCHPTAWDFHDKKVCLKSSNMTDYIHMHTLLMSRI